ncbi:arginase [Paenibacillus soyae]|uniref:Arginase n=1 Tax=Paenibacillus soyae TaxID=2969249 RepID=A0A9X2SB77_9BACL|nr:arginase [Paenibacillus soyae]MCR2807006.1 arginase [Paenibacillus soyae]
MKKKQLPPVAIISAPFGMGGAIPGAEYGPQALLRAGLAERLQALGRTVTCTTAEVTRQQERTQQLPLTNQAHTEQAPRLPQTNPAHTEQAPHLPQTNPAHTEQAPHLPQTTQAQTVQTQQSPQPVPSIQAPKDTSSRTPSEQADSNTSNGDRANTRSSTEPNPVKNIEEVLAICRLIAQNVKQAADAGAFPLLIGGDHSVAMGSLAGLSRSGKRLGVIWLDAHGDINSEQTSPTGNAHGMVLSVATGLSWLKLQEICDTGALLDPHRIVIVGARDLDDGEKRILAHRGIRCFTMSDVDRLGIRSVMKRAVAAAGNGTDGIHVSLDLDVLDPQEAPGVGTPVPGGLTYREARYAMEMLYESGAVTSMDIVEVNPMLDPGGRTAELAVSLAETLFGKRLI